MKSYIVPTVLSILILAGCSSTKSTADYDDVYYSAKKKKDNKQTEVTAEPDYYVQSDAAASNSNIENYDAGDYVSYEDQPAYTETETLQNPDGTTNITNNYYGGSPYDYYDYSYSAMINRFYSPYI
jgi:PBP1b-binding outer membrane lipoprotein LpoB